MTLAERYCVSCGIIIERPFWLCSSCEDAWGVRGVNYRNWPEGLKWLKNNAKHEEYEEARGHVSLEELVEKGVSIDSDGVLPGIVRVFS